MTLPAAPQRDAATPALPRATQALIAQLDGWTHTITHARGPCTFGGLSEETDGEGKRHRVEVTEDVDSVCLRARHDDGRRLVAVWIKRKSWTPDVAFRWPWPWEHGVPLQLTATALTLPAERAAGRIVGEGPDAVPELVRLLQTEAKVL